MNGLAEKTEKINFSMADGAYAARAKPPERMALDAIMAMEFMNQSEVIRMLIREGAKARGLWPPQEAHGGD